MGIIEFVLALISQSFWALIGFDFLKVASVFAPFLVIH